MAGLRKHLEEMVGDAAGHPPQDDPAKARAAAVRPREREPQTKPAPKDDTGGVCPKCGLRGRAPGHH